MSDASHGNGSALIPSAILSFATMMGGMIVVLPIFRLSVGLLRPESVAEHITAALIATPLPTAFVVFAVFWPVVYAVKWWRGPSKLILGVAGALSSPLAALLLLGIGTALWGPIRRSLLTLDGLVFLSIYAAGGLVFGVTSAWLAKASPKSN